MGLCCSGSLEQAKSRAIDKQNRQDNASERAKVKLLLLGAGESGKSTIFKQMKLLFGDGFTDEERNDHARVIRSNVLSEIAKLCKALTAFELDGELTPEARDAFNALTDPHFLGPEATGAYKLGFDDALVGHVRRLWADPASEKVWARRSETQLIESNRCFFEKLDEIKDASYLPTDEDIVASRARTSGIIEEKYTIGASGGGVGGGGSRGHAFAAAPRAVSLTSALHRGCALRHHRRRRPALRAAQVDACLRRGDRGHLRRGLV